MLHIVLAVCWRFLSPRYFKQPIYRGEILMKMSCLNLTAYISPVKADFDFAMKLSFMRFLKCQHDFVQHQ